MSTALPYATAAFVLLLLGLHALIVHPHLLRKILALNVMSAAVFLLLIALAARTSDAPDPVPHAMVLTGIVVAVSASAFALALARRIHADSGSHSLEEALERSPTGAEPTVGGAGERSVRHENAGGPSTAEGIRPE